LNLGPGRIKGYHL